MFDAVLHQHSMPQILPVRNFIGNMMAAIDIEQLPDDLVCRKSLARHNSLDLEDHT